MTKSKDATEAIRKKASQYAGVDQGMACTQSAFKVGRSSFLYIGEQGGRYKAMFKLEASLAEAESLAKAEPGNYQVGSTSWVTARFSNEQPMPTKLWRKWLEESYQLSVQGKTSVSRKKTTDLNSKRKPRKSK